MTVTVEPASVGSLPETASASKMTCQLPAGSWLLAAQIPFEAVPLISDMGIVRLGMSALTLAASVPLVL